MITLSAEIGRIEDEVLADRFTDTKALGTLRRELSRYAREFAGLKSAIHRAMSTRHGGLTGSPLLEHLPVLMQDVEDFDRDAAGLTDRARLIYEEIETRIGSATNRSLSLLTEAHVTRMQKAGFRAILPGVESWYDMGGKSRTGSNQGIEKVRKVADHVNMILRHIPYVQTNFVLGLDCDEGPEPFELTKTFVDLCPGAFPAYSLLTAFGQAAPLNLEYQRAGRVQQQVEPLRGNDLTDVGDGPRIGDSRRRARGAPPRSDVPDDGQLPRGNAAVQQLAADVLGAAHQPIGERAHDAAPQPLVELALRVSQRRRAIHDRHRTAAIVPRENRDHPGTRSGPGRRLAP